MTMEEKRREVTAQPLSKTDSPASEPPSSRRRPGGQKRKANTLNASNSSSAPSKRITREKALPAHQPIHNGPLTRARQVPNNFAASALDSAAVGGSASSAVAVKHSEHVAATEALVRELVAPAEEFNKLSEWEALEAGIEAEFESIRSRDASAHVVPSHCGWFSWTDIHPIEKHTLSSFFNKKIENRTPDVYMEIRNWIIKKFHANPNAQIELKDLSELNVGDLDARQEVMEFLDHWGLINFHPFPSMDSAVASVDNKGAAEKNSLVQKLYHFETLQLCPPVVPKTKVMTPAMPSGLFPESTIAEELAKQEGPSVEYHCNSCSADCSRKRYHCQKQADFDLCTDCFNNGKFGSGMSSSDFILMEPGEVPGVSGGKWTDQETLLLLEALELYKENWNEIAEHVATKTKAQCILHFVQMPIEDTFLDRDDDIDASCNETADPTATNNDSSVLKDAFEMNESKTSDGGEGQVLTSNDETSKAEGADKVEVNKETPKPEDVGQQKVSEGTEGTSKPEDTTDMKFHQEASDNCALKALKEAFEAVGYSPGTESPSSFAEVGNPVMALAVFLAHFVGSDMAVASTHSSLKSISGSSPSIELAARHCFLLEDPPDDKNEATSSERDCRKGGDQDGKTGKQDGSMLADKDLSNDQNNKNSENNASEENRQMTSANGSASEKPMALANHEKGGLKNCSKLISNNSALPNYQSPSTVEDSHVPTSMADVPPGFEGLKEKISVKEPCPAEKSKGGRIPPEKNEPQKLISSNPVREHLKASGAPKEAETVSDTITSVKSNPQKPLSASPIGESLETKDLVMDVDLVSSSLMEKNGSRPFVSSESSPNRVAEKGVDTMSSSVPSDKNEPLHLLASNSGAENVANTGEDHNENDAKGKDDCTKTKHDNKFEKVKRAAVSTLAAAAVKAKLLAKQEEDHIRQLATLLIEKQVHKLETKLAFFNEMENAIMRVREHLDRSRQKLYHERALIIASRLGLPASSSRGVPPSLPTNRIPLNFANSVPRPPFSMNSQRPSISRPMGSAVTALSNSLSPPTAAGSLARPSSQDRNSSDGTK